jgi:hypothetical protein
MYTGLVHLHSTLAYVVLLFLIFTVIKSAIGHSRGGEFRKGDNQIQKLALIFLHSQVVIGLIMYFQSPYFQALQEDAGAVMGNSDTRLLAVEHLTVMLIGAILFTVGRVKSRKATDGMKKHKTMLIFAAITLVLVLSRIPWNQWFA